MQNTPNSNDARDQARAQLDKIKCLVAAMGVDYERLEDLRTDFLAEANGATDSPLSQEDIDELNALAALAGPCTDQEEAIQAIQDDALEILTRGDWHGALDNGSEDVELQVLLCTGGPAVRIIADLEDGVVTDSRIEYQDWGTPWLRLLTYTHEDKQAVREYCCALGF